LFLTSGEENPTTLNFLPDTHIMVISKQDILGSYEDAWNALRKVYGARTLPRAVNLVSGPSRTADIEQIIVMGAHGPRRLHVIIVE
jgi:L-lactate dehydrogenase complex protein LldG